MRRRGSSAFTLLELLVVIGLVAALSSLLFGRLAGGGRAGALQSAQATLVNLVAAARTKALASGRSSRLLVHVDPDAAGRPPRFLRRVVLQTQTEAGWQTVDGVFLPDGIYVLPGNFAAIPGGLFDGNMPWLRQDGAALRSTALRANMVLSAAVDRPVSEQWAGLIISANAGTAQPGDIVLATGRVRPPGSYGAGESPVRLENPELVRGLSLSAYAVPTLINTRAGF